MRRIRSLTAAVAVGALALLGSAAYAGNPHQQPSQPQQPAQPHGNSGNAPGQQKAHPAHPAKPAKPAKAKTHGNSAVAHATHAQTHSTAQVFANHAGKPRHNVPPGAVAGYQQHPESFGGPGRSGIHKYTVCHNGHAITVDVHSWNAHVGRHGDTLLPYGTKGKQACGETKAAPPATKAPCAPASPGGVWHHTGSKTNPFVLIHPSTHSAHYSKHADDKIVSGAAGSAASCGTVGTLPIATRPLPRIVGGVLGVRGTLASKPARAAAPAAKAAQARSGVLGAAGALGSKVTRGSLPFTGFPLWVAVLIAAALLAGGALIRARART